MKYVLLIAVLSGVFAFRANAQTGMPQSLSCTETAFNFSFSLGNKWKFVAPKMGPVEIRKTTGDLPSWAFRPIEAKPETHLWVLPIKYSFRTKDKQQYLLPPLKFDAFIRPVTFSLATN